MTYSIVVVGTSWGGLNALRELVGQLPADFRIPTILVQHRHRQSDHLLSTFLQERTQLTVVEVEDKMPIEPRTLFVAPADYHLLIDRDVFTLSTDPPVRYSRPSIDVTFYSTADAYGSAAIGVILTGANSDGSRGLRRIFDRGGVAMVQDPSTAESATMPSAAIRCVPEARVLPISRIASALSELTSEKPSERSTPPSPAAFERGGDTLPRRAAPPGGA
ncbi:MAG TPA: chemotaxis protein CheB [Gemmatimonadaceae bacterium]|nr:chemotaxis protein CheB [Gemmatimonadaceae bacterium]